MTALKKNSDCGHAVVQNSQDKTPCAQCIYVFQSKSNLCKSRTNLAHGFNCYVLTVDSWIMSCTGKYFEEAQIIF